MSCALRLQRAGELVWAGGAVAALDALQKRDNLLDLSSNDEFRDALRIAGASPNELALRHNPVRDWPRFAAEAEVRDDFVAAISWRLNQP